MASEIKNNTPAKIGKIHGIANNLGSYYVYKLVSGSMWQNNARSPEKSEYLQKKIGKIIHGINV